MKWFETIFKRKERKSRTTRLEPWQYELTQLNPDVRNPYQYDMTGVDSNVRKPNRRKNCYKEK